MNFGAYGVSNKLACVISSDLIREAGRNVHSLRESI